MAKRRIVVDISDAKVSGEQGDVLVTYSLGSCIGVCAYDKGSNVGGMIHYQLPDSKIDPERAKRDPYMFADTGLELLIKQLERMGVNKKRLQVKIAGGANMATGPKGFDIGKRNYLAVRKLLWRYGIFIDAEDVGGSSPRNLYLDLGTGSVTVRCVGLEKTL